MTEEIDPLIVEALYLVKVESESTSMEYVPIERMIKLGDNLTVYSVLKEILIDLTEKKLVRRKGDSDMFCLTRAGYDQLNRQDAKIFIDKFENRRDESGLSKKEKQILCKIWKMHELFSPGNFWYGLFDFIKSADQLEGEVFLKRMVALGILSVEHKPEEDASKIHLDVYRVKLSDYGRQYLSKNCRGFL